MTEEGAATDTFHFYLKFAKPLVLNLPDPHDRVLAAAWIRKLSDPGLADENTRKDYLKLLLFVLHRRRLIGPFSDNPGDIESLEVFPLDFKVNEVARDLLLAEDDEHKKRIKKGLGGDEYPPYTTECSADLLEYAAAQDIPRFGVHAYYALSNEPITKWDNFEKGIFPKGTTTEIGNKSLGPAASTPTVGGRSKGSDKTPQRLSKQPSQKISPKAQKSADALLSPQKDEKSPTQMKSLLGSPIRTDERAPITWGSNLIDVTEPPDVQLSDVSMTFESTVSEGDFSAITIKSFGSPQRDRNTTLASLPYKTPPRWDLDSTGASLPYKTPPRWDLDSTGASLPYKTPPRWDLDSTAASLPYKSPSKQLHHFFDDIPDFDIGDEDVPDFDSTPESFLDPSFLYESSNQSAGQRTLDSAPYRTPPRWDLDSTGASLPYKTPPRWDLDKTGASLPYKTPPRWDLDKTGASLPYKTPPRWDLDKTGASLPYKTPPRWDLDKTGASLPYKTPPRWDLDSTGASLPYKTPPRWDLDSTAASIPYRTPSPKKKQSGESLSPRELKENMADVSVSGGATPEAKDLINEVNASFQSGSPISPSAFDKYYPGKRMDMPRTPPMFSKFEAIRKGLGPTAHYEPQEFGLTGDETWQSGADFKFEELPKGYYKQERPIKKHKPIEEVFPGMANRNEWDQIFFDIQQPELISDDEDLGDIESVDLGTQLKEIIEHAKEDTQSIPAAGGVATTTPKSSSSPARIYENVAYFDLDEEDMPDYLSPPGSPATSPLPSQRPRSASPRPPSPPREDEYGLPYLSSERPKPPSPKPQRPKTPEKSPDIGVRTPSRTSPPKSSPTSPPKQPSPGQPTPPKSVPTSPSKQPSPGQPTTPSKQQPSGAKTPSKSPTVTIQPQPSDTTEGTAAPPPQIDHEVQADKQFAALYDTLIADIPPIPPRSPSGSTQPQGNVFDESISEQLPSPIRPPAVIHGYQTPPHLKIPKTPPAARPTAAFPHKYPADDEIIDYEGEPELLPGSPQPPTPPMRQMTPPRPPEMFSFDEYAPQLEDVGDEMAIQDFLETHEMEPYRDVTDDYIVVKGHRVPMTRKRAPGIPTLEEEPDFIHELPSPIRTIKTPKRLVYDPIVRRPPPPESPEGSPQRSPHQQIPQSPRQQQMLPSPQPGPSQSMSPQPGPSRARTPPRQQAATAESAEADVEQTITEVQQQFLADFEDPKQVQLLQRVLHIVEDVENAPPLMPHRAPSPKRQTEQLDERDIFAEGFPTSETNIYDDLTAEDYEYAQANKVDYKKQFDFEGPLEEFMPEYQPPAPYQLPPLKRLELTADDLPHPVAPFYRDPNEIFMSPDALNWRSPEQIGHDTPPNLVSFSPSPARSGQRRGSPQGSPQGSPVGLPDSPFVRGQAAPRRSAGKRVIVTEESDIMSPRAERGQPLITREVVRKRIDFDQGGGSPEPPKLLDPSMAQVGQPIPRIPLPPTIIDLTTPRPIHIDLTSPQAGPSHAMSPQMQEERGRGRARKRPQMRGKRLDFDDLPPDTPQGPLTQMLDSPRRFVSESPSARRIHRRSRRIDFSQEGGSPEPPKAIDPSSVVIGGPVPRSKPPGEYPDVMSPQTRALYLLEQQHADLPQLPRSPTPQDLFGYQGNVPFADERTLLDAPIFDNLPSPIRPPLTIPGWQSPSAPKMQPTISQYFPPSHEAYFQSIRSEQAPIDDLNISPVTPPRPLGTSRQGFSPSPPPLTTQRDRFSPSPPRESQRRPPTVRSSFYDPEAILEGSRIMGEVKAHEYTRQHKDSQKRFMRKSVLSGAKQTRLGQRPPGLPMTSELEEPPESPLHRRRMYHTPPSGRASPATPRGMPPQMKKTETTTIIESPSGTETTTIEEFETSPGQQQAEEQTRQLIATADQQYASLFDSPEEGVYQTPSRRLTVTPRQENAEQAMQKVMDMAEQQYAMLLDSPVAGPSHQQTPPRQMLPASPEGGFRTPTRMTPPQRWSQIPDDMLLDEQAVELVAGTPPRSQKAPVSTLSPVSFGEDMYIQQFSPLASVQGGDEHARTSPRRTSPSPRVSMKVPQPRSPQSHAPAPPPPPPFPPTSMIDRVEELVADMPIPDNYAPPSFSPHRDIGWQSPKRSPQTRTVMDKDMLDFEGIPDLGSPKTPPRTPPPSLNADIMRKSPPPGTVIEETEYTFEESFQEPTTPQRGSPRSPMYTPTLQAQSRSPYYTPPQPPAQHRPQHSPDSLLQGALMRAEIASREYSHHHKDSAKEHIQSYVNVGTSGKTMELGRRRPKLPVMAEIPEPEMSPQQRPWRSPPRVVQEGRLIDYSPERPPPSPEMDPTAEIMAIAEQQYASLLSPQQQEEPGTIVTTEIIEEYMDSPEHLMDQNRLPSESAGLPPPLLDAIDLSWRSPPRPTAVSVPQRYEYEETPPRQQKYMTPPRVRENADDDLNVSSPMLYGSPGMDSFDIPVGDNLDFMSPEILRTPPSPFRPSPHYQEIAAHTIDEDFRDPTRPKQTSDSVVIAGRARYIPRHAPRPSFAPLLERPESPVITGRLGRPTLYAGVTPPSGRNVRYSPPPMQELHRLEPDRPFTVPGRDDHEYDMWTETPGQVDYRENLGQRRGPITANRFLSFNESMASSTGGQDLSMSAPGSPASPMPASLYEPLPAPANLSPARLERYYKQVYGSPEMSPQQQSPYAQSPRAQSPRGQSPRGQSPRGPSPRGQSPQAMQQPQFYEETIDEEITYDAQGSPVQEYYYENVEMFGGDFETQIHDTSDIPLDVGDEGDDFNFRWMDR